MIQLLRQMLRFSAVGVTAFGIDYGLMIFFTEIFGFDYLISATSSFILSTVFNYIASMRFVFSHREGLSRSREFVIFCILSGIGLALNNNLLWFSVDALGFDYRVAKIFVGLLVSVWNFISRRIFLDGGSNFRLLGAARHAS